MRERFLASGSIVTAILSSFCCIGPLILAAVGMSGAGFVAPVVKYRPIFIGVTFAILGASYYFTYGRRKKPCCPAEARPRRNWAQEITLWVITVIAVGVAAFPYAEGLVARQHMEKASVTREGLHFITLQVQGMTCDHCATSVKAALLRYPGVKFVEVDPKTGKVKVGYEKDSVALSTQALLKAIEDSGYKGSIIAN